METKNWPEALTRFGIEDPLEPAKAAPRMRKSLRQAAPFLDSAAPPLKSVEDFTIAGPAGEIAARLYIPQGSQTPAPLCFFTHGGGYVIGDLETLQNIRKKL